MPGPMAAWRPAALLVLLLLAVPGLAWDGAAQGPRIVPRLAELRAGYGLEAWKDEPPLAPLAEALPLPLPGEGAFGVYENPYLGRPHQGPQPWLGYNLTAILELVDEAGVPLAAPTHVVRARLAWADGEVPAKLARLAPGRFAATFDLDGEADTERPAVPPGPVDLEVEAYEQAAAPGGADRRVAEATFQLTAAQPRLDVGGFLLGDAALGYADIGEGNMTLVRPQLARPGEGVTLVADFGIPEAAVALTAWHGARGAVLVEGRTDAAGVFAATVDPVQLVGGDASGLAIVAAHLTGPGARVGNAVAAVPVSAHVVRIARYAYDAPPVEPLAMLAVGVEDLSAPPPGPAAPARGTLYVLDAGGEVGASAPFPPTSFAPGQPEREARLPAQALPRENTSYRLLALLQTGDNRLYSMAQAVRGFDVSVASVVGAPFTGGELTVVVRNFNTNLDDVEDVGLEFPIHVAIAGLPNGSYAKDVTVPEAGEVRLRVPFIGDVGTFPLAVTATGGEFVREASATLRIDPPRSALPGFEALAGIAALALAVHRRRTRA